MDLIEYSKAGNPVLYFPDGEGTGRLAAEVFRVPGGVVVADSGWSEPMNPTHPFHFLEGEICNKEDPDGDLIEWWAVGPHAFRELLDCVDVQVGSWRAWQGSEYRRPRVDAAAEIQADLGIVPIG